MFRTTAHVYDLIYGATGKDYAAEAALVDQIIRERNETAASLLDVACGTGGHLRHLRSRYEVVGLDVDRGMLEQARTALPEVTLVEDDMRSFSLAQRFDAVVCLFSSIGYMQSVEELNAAVGCMAAHLSAGGVLIVDGWIRRDAWIDPGMVHAEAAKGDGIAVARAGKSRRDGNKTYLELHHLVANTDGIEYLIDHHQLTLFTGHEYEERSALPA